MCIHVSDGVRSNVTWYWRDGSFPLSNVIGRLAVQRMIILLRKSHHEAIVDSNEAAMQKVTPDSGDMKLRGTIFEICRNHVLR